MSLALYTATGHFSVATTRCDHTRAHIDIYGGPDPAAAEILQAVLDGHIRAGRRYLRIGLPITSAPAEPSSSTSLFGICVRFPTTLTD